MQRQLTRVDLQSRKAKFLSPNEAEIPFYVKHINTYLCEDPFLKNYLPMDPTGNQLFNLIKDGVLLCKLINLAVPGAIDERAINKKTSLNLWERNINHTLCLNSAKAIGCTVVNIGAQDLEEGRPHLVLGLLSQIIKIHLMKTLQHERKDIDMSDSPEKMKNGEMIEDGDSDEDMGEADEDMGDADSDDIYEEGFRISDEMESEDDEEESDDDDEEESDDYEFKADNYNQSLEAGGAEEKRPEVKHTIVDILDDEYDLQVESGFVTRWALFNTSFPCMSPRRFLAKLQDTCLSLGMMKFATWPIREFRGIVDLAAIENSLDKLKIELVLLIPPCPNGVKIEAMCQNLGIAYQSCYPEGPLKSLAREIQHKVVKRLVRLRRLELPLVRDAPTIIFGAGMVQGAGLEHVASVAVSVDWPKFRKYLGVLSYQQYEGIIEDLYDTMIYYFKCFYKKNKKWPKKLIFFRNEPWEGDFDHIYRQEINAIEQACASNDMLFTYVVVVPLIASRSGESLYKFYCRHNTEETSKVACYSVVHDGNHFPAGELQALTSQLCTFRHRRKNPYIHRVVPAYHAWQQAVEELDGPQK